MVVGSSRLQADPLGRLGRDSVAQVRRWAGVRIGTHVRMWWGPQGFERFRSIFLADGLVVLFVEQVLVHSPSQFVLFFRASHCRRRRCRAG